MYIQYDIYIHNCAIDACGQEEETEGGLKDRVSAHELQLGVCIYTHTHTHTLYLICCIFI